MTAARFVTHCAKSLVCGLGDGRFTIVVSTLGPATKRRTVRLQRSGETPAGAAVEQR